MSGSFEAAGNAAFRPLASYIGGADEVERRHLDDRAGRAARAPSEQPATVSETEDGAHVIAFVLPSTIAATGAPAPADPRVRIRVVPEEQAAVASYSGRWTEHSYRKHVDELVAAMADVGLAPGGPPRFARFDPPWKPWFARRNEVVIPVA
ncbi:MAG: heme-binding protein [Dermatophilaceae bacterium]